MVALTICLMLVIYGAITTFMTRPLERDLSEKKLTADMVEPEA